MAIQYVVTSSCGHTLLTPPTDIQQPHWAERFKYQIGPRNASYIRKLYAICDMPLKLMLLGSHYIDGLVFTLGTDLSRVQMLAIGFPRCFYNIPYSEYSRWQNNADFTWLRPASKAQVRKYLTLGSHSRIVAQWFVFEGPRWKA